MKLTSGEKKLQELEKVLKARNTDSKSTSTKNSSLVPNNNEIVLKRLFFDIETSPNVVYSWNIGYNINLSHDNIITERAVICISYKWEHEKDVKHLTWKDGCDKDMILKFFDIIKEAQEIVGHNGDKYDLAWFRTRAIYHGIKNMPEFKTIDTLKTARKHFKFNSNKLDYISKFLGLGSKVNTGGFELWKRVIKGDRKALADMVHYCDNDVLLLEKVYIKLSGYMKPKTHIGVLMGKHKCTCKHCGNNGLIIRGYNYNATGTKSINTQCKKCNRYSTFSITDWNKVVN